MKKVCVFIANGLEECEALITVDILRRAGIQVTTASIHDTKNILSSHQISFTADALLSELNPEEFEMFFLPGGLGGTANLSASPLVNSILLSYSDRDDKLLSAICAAPSVLGGLGFLKGRKATCYPGWEEKLSGAQHTGADVEEDGHIITGKGMGVTIPFALKLVERLISKAKADEIRRQIQYPYEV